MITIAQFIAVSCYIGAAAVAAAPFARPVKAPLGWVVGLLVAGVGTHALGLAAAVSVAGQLPVTGLGPALSFAALSLATTLIVVEVLAKESTLTVLAAPTAAAATVAANVIGLRPVLGTDGIRGLWLEAHITLSLIGLAGLATAAAAGTMYLFERRALRLRHFGAVFRFFPPLETLDRVNHVAAVMAWLTLTLGIVLAASYAMAQHIGNMPQIIWGCAAWAAATTLATGRVWGGWQARRAAMLSAIAFIGVVVLYLVIRLGTQSAGAFL